MDIVVQLLKEKGLRFTSQKRDVLYVLRQKPQTVLEIHTAVKSKKKVVNKATIYRILTSFTELGIVKEVHLGDREVRYELTNNEHHHHLVCEDCGSIEDVKLCEDTLIKDVQKQSHFKIKSHSLEFFGTCKKCQ